VTLLELLVVVGIILIVAAATIPRLRPEMERGRLREAARALHLYINSARATAMNGGRSCGVQFDRQPSESRGSITVSQVQVPEPYQGDSYASTLKITMQEPMNRLGIAGVTIPYPYKIRAKVLYLDFSKTANVHLNDTIQLGPNGPLYQIIPDWDVTTNGGVSPSPGTEPGPYLPPPFSWQSSAITPDPTVTAIDYSNMSPDADGYYSAQYPLTLKLVDPKYDPSLPAGCDPSLLVKNGNPMSGPPLVDPWYTHPALDPWYLPPLPWPVTLVNRNNNTSNYPSNPVWSLPIPFKVYRQPVKTSAAPLQLPSLTMVDMAISGLEYMEPLTATVGQTRSKFFGHGTNRVMLMFSPNGGLDRVYCDVLVCNTSGTPTGVTWCGGAPGGISVNGTMYFYVGRSDRFQAPLANPNDPSVDPKAGDSNVVDLNAPANGIYPQNPNGQWIAINAKTGTITTTDVMPANVTALQQLNSNINQPGIGTSDNATTQELEEFQILFDSRSSARQSEQVGGR
jgi:type II secretory pathway pseudopilin PulG